MKKHKNRCQNPNDCLLVTLLFNCAIRPVDNSRACSNNAQNNTLTRPAKCEYRIAILETNVPPHRTLPFHLCITVIAALSSLLRWIFFYFFYGLHFLKQKFADYSVTSVFTFT